MKRKGGSERQRRAFLGVDKDFCLTCIILSEIQVEILSVSWKYKLGHQ
jgi:hypothetical protein